MINCTIGTTTATTTVILPETTTIRQAFEANNINYAVGMNTLDGATLAPGDMDKSFADMGITSRCYLLSIVKANCAVTTKICGSAFVITSGIKLEDIKKLEKYEPSVCTLYKSVDGKPVPDFRIGTHSGSGTLNEYGAEFSAQGSENDFGTITIMIPEGITDRKQYVVDNYGAALYKINLLEAQMNEAAENVRNNLNMVADAIEVL